MNEAPEPWLLVLETLSTHPPYLDPDSGRHSLELVMRYADRTFGGFLEGVAARGLHRVAHQQADREHAAEEHGRMATGDVVHVVAEASTGYEAVDLLKQKPDIEVTGEAFSAHGFRKGNLVICRARLELKARDVESGKILFTSSQTSVAADITEQTAAKTALENAALEIAGRLLPAVK